MRFVSHLWYVNAMLAMISGGSDGLSPSSGILQIDREDPSSALSFRVSIVAALERQKRFLLLLAPNSCTPRSGVFIAGACRTRPLCVYNCPYVVEFRRLVGLLSTAGMLENQPPRIFMPDSLSSCHCGRLRQRSSAFHRELAYVELCLGSK